MLGIPPKDITKGQSNQQGGCTDEEILSPPKTGKALKPPNGLSNVVSPPPVHNNHTDEDNNQQKDNHSDDEEPDEAQTDNDGTIEPGDEALVPRVVNYSFAACWGVLEQDYNDDQFVTTLEDGTKKSMTRVDVDDAFAKFHEGKNLTGLNYNLLRVLWEIKHTHPDPRVMSTIINNTNNISDAMISETYQPDQEDSQEGA